MKYILISHLDLDGAACAVLFKLAFGNEARYVLTGVGNMESVIEQEITNAIADRCNNYTIYVSDLAIGKDTLNFINSSISSKVTITYYDHHDSSIKLKNELRYRWMYVNENECGTSLLAYIALTGKMNMSDAVINFIEDVRARDLYMFEERETAAVLHSCLVNYHTSTFIGTMIKRLQNTNDPFGYLVDQDYKQYEYAKRYKERYISEFGYASGMLNGHNVAVVFSSRFVSEVCSYIFGKDPEIDYVMVVNTDKEVIQVRAPKDGGIDLTEIFKDATGHKHALSIPYTRSQVARVFMDYVINKSEEYKVLSKEDKTDDRYEEEFTEDDNGSGCTEDIEHVESGQPKRSSKRYDKRRRAAR